MTRINCIPVEELSNKHLVSEYRELPRVFGLIKGYQKRKRKSMIPSKYVLGTGHVTFFYDKALYLLNRQKQLVSEMQRRGYKPQFTNCDDLLNGIEPKYINDWQPTKEAIALNKARIRERLSS